MSGRIFMNVEENEVPTWNPLQCQICEEQYRDPRILACYHSFCVSCLEDRIQDGAISCHVCGSVSELGENASLPPSDLLLKFLVETSAGEKVLCANCDKTSDQMYFCNTCCQSLCGPCREETHRARMFTKHDVVLHTKHTRDIQKECRVHGEPYILFSTEKKLMLCINCFRDMKIESRSHCVDLDTAYKQSFHKLDDAMQSIRDLQTSVRDGILLLHALLEELEINVGKEKQAILELYDTMVEKITETKAAMLTEIDRQHAEKEEMFKDQLVSLTTFLPTLRTHMVTCAAFCGSANKYEFLDFTYVLMKRLTAIIQVQHPLHPSQTSDIVTDFKSKFAKCLEPLLFPPRNGLTTTLPSSSITASVVNTSSELSPCINATMSSLSGGLYSRSCMGGGRNNHDSTKFKLKLCENKGFFSDHCKEFDDAHRELMQTVEGLKTTVQELQRDITIRRSLTKDSSFTELMKRVAKAEERLNNHQIIVEGKQTGLEKHWEECLERIAGEQDVYRAQLQDVCRLKTEVNSVRTIAQRLSSFMSSIANVTQRLAPKLSAANKSADQDMQHAALLQEISTMQPDSQQRVDAIKSTHEQIDHKKANRTNPLDEELIKTKGLLRAPSARKEGSKRSSMEVGDEDVMMMGRELMINSNLSAMTQLREKLNSEIRFTGCILSASASVAAATAAARDSARGASEKVVTKETSLECLDSDSKGLTKLEDAISVSKEKELEIKATVQESDDSKKDDSDATDDFLNSSLVLDSSSSDISMDTSVDSSASDQVEDAKPKPGLVKDLIAKVDSIGKQPLSVKTDVKELDHISETAVFSDSPLESPEVQDLRNLEVRSPTKQKPIVSPRAAKTDEEKLRNKIPFNEEECNGQRKHVSVGNGHIENGLYVKSDGSVISDDDLNELVVDNVGEGVLNGGKVKNGDGVPVVSGVKVTEGERTMVGEEAVEEEEEVYVTKSLPELAQVFEPGELKRKKKVSKSERSRNHKEK